VFSRNALYKSTFYLLTYLQMSICLLSEGEYIDCVVDCMQECSEAVQHGGGPADKLKLKYALSHVKKLTSSSLVKRCHGVGAVGYAVVQPDERLPHNDFFLPQRQFRVRFRSVIT